MVFLVPAQKQEYVKTPCTNSQISVYHRRDVYMPGFKQTCFQALFHSRISCWSFYHTIFFSFFTFFLGGVFWGFLFLCMCFCFWIEFAWAFFHSLLTKQILFYLFTPKEFCYYSDFHNFNCSANVWKMSFWNASWLTIAQGSMFGTCCVTTCRVLVVLHVEHLDYSMHNKHCQNIQWVSLQRSLTAKLNIKKIILKINLKHFLSVMSGSDTPGTGNITPAARYLWFHPDGQSGCTWRAGGREYGWTACEDTGKRFNRLSGFPQLACGNFWHFFRSQSRCFSLLKKIKYICNISVLNFCFWLRRKFKLWSH